MKCRGEIDGLRAVAILPVVAYHADIGWVSGGFLGVQVFFVISGFLITSLLVGDLREGRFSVAGFYRQRILRIFPALFAVVAAACAAGRFRMFSSGFESLGASVATATPFVSNIHFRMTSSHYTSS